MMRTIVYLALGSNLKSRQKNLSAAITGLKSHGELLALSRVYETEPVGYREQPAFLNQACKMAIKYSPLELLDATQGIEKEIGRRPTFPSGPRVIDIDLLFYGERIIHVHGLDIPHPKLHERRFVLEPMCEIAPDLVHPELALTMRELLAHLKDEHWVRPVEGDDDVRTVR